MNLLLFALIAGFSLNADASGRKPAEKNSKKDVTLHDVKEGTNDFLWQVDKGVHQGAAAAKKGANDALIAVDKGIHKAVDK